MQDWEMNPAVGKPEIHQRIRLVFVGDTKYHRI
jgi:hypothetical protein